jgi:hypothetical protein
MFKAMDFSGGGEGDLVVMMRKPDRIFQDVIAQTLQTCTTSSLDADHLEFGDRYRMAQQLLKNEVLANYETLVRTAASSGMTHADLLSYNAQDKYEGITLLSLVRGPTDPDNRRLFKRLGLRPLLHDLQRCMRPFGVSHEWNAGTLLNRVIVTWMPSYLVS